jgi:hypothetical protein
VSVRHLDLSHDGSSLWERQRRDTEPDETLLRVTAEFRSHWAEGTMPPSLPALPGPSIPRARKKPLTIVAIGTPQGPRHPMAWFAAVLAVSIASCIATYLVTR